jgi:regulation of enolase protein 1 (concanavalin A-like superfamily)
MAPDRSCFDTVNSLQPSSSISEMEYFTLTAQPGTSIWRTPGSEDTITAPTIFTALREPLIVAEVTVTANLEYEWDQAGLAIFAGAPPDVEDRGRPDHNRWPARRWAKAGLEICRGTPHASCTAAVSSSGADCSLVPLPSTPDPQTSYTAASSIRIKFERLGDALWVWYQQPQSSCYSTMSHTPDEVSNEWRKIREVTGFFWGIDSKSGVWIGCYASRPMQWVPVSSIAVAADDDRNSLWVEFEDLEIV